MQSSINPSAIVTSPFTTAVSFPSGWIIGALWFQSMGNSSNAQLERLTQSALLSHQHQHFKGEWFILTLSAFNSISFNLINLPMLQMTNFETYFRQFSNKKWSFWPYAHSILLLPIRKFHPGLNWLILKPISCHFDQFWPGMLAKMVNLTPC